jgi:two-component system chemotaxis response regulator CheB
VERLTVKPAPEGRTRFKLVVIGVSAGGIVAMKTLFGALPRNFALPIVVVHHVLAEARSSVSTLLGSGSAMHIKEAEEGERLVAGTVYIAPPNYHLLVERDGTLALSTEALVNFARPSVDVLFESAALAFRAGVIGVVLTGANSDGAAGLRAIQLRGGLAVVQDPDDAEIDSMPRAALEAVEANRICTLDALAGVLQQLAEEIGE